MLALCPTCLDQTLSWRGGQERPGESRPDFPPSFQKEGGRRWRRGSGGNGALRVWRRLSPPTWIAATSDAAIHARAPITATSQSAGAATSQPTLQSHSFNELQSNSNATTNSAHSGSLSRSELEALSRAPSVIGSVCGNTSGERPATEQTVRGAAQPRRSGSGRGRRARTAVPRPLDSQDSRRESRSRAVSGH